MAGVTPFHKKSSKDDLMDCKAVSFNMVSEEQVFLDVVFGHTKEKPIGNSQHRLTKGKSCVTNLMPSSDAMMREEQWLLSTLMRARSLKGSLTIQLYPAWNIMVRKDSMTIRDWSSCPRRRG